jgi:hypothetical protein
LLDTFWRTVIAERGGVISSTSPGDLFEFQSRRRPRQGNFKPLLSL